MNGNNKNATRGEIRFSKARKNIKPTRETAIISSKAMNKWVYLDHGCLDVKLQTQPKPVPSRLCQLNPSYLHWSATRRHRLFLHHLHTAEPQRRQNIIPYAMALHSHGRPDPSRLKRLSPIYVQRPFLNTQCDLPQMEQIRWSQKSHTADRPWSTSTGGSSAL